ncbi:DUF6903 family protein [Caproiciproducens sp. MSJ-32]|uniref:DUF6903 family protein n=1 Tax=Caproiciproducens sp. MSJ-32 TaxID=2841527 RepID=UPI001C0FFC3A|nr:hypothetical protein [Caproiciproducens sp. MSJ-32]MBU5455653.1 hypothetical protein [Caproiciproducens sp. MSJ-32]
MSTAVKITINIIAFIVFLGMIIVGQKNIGVPGLCVMLAGLTGLLTQLFLYNKKHK